MRADAPLLLAPLLALVACGGGAPAGGGQVTGQLADEAAAQERIAALSGWDRLFGAPAATIGAANQFGFRAPDYAGSPGAYKAVGSDIFVGRTTVSDVNKASFAAAGALADRIDTLTLGLLIQDPQDAATAKQRFAALIRDFLFQAKAPGADVIAAAVEAEAPAKGALPGVTWTLARQPYPRVADGRRLIVTFTRAETKSATSSS